jgi:hypothetical protein
MYLRGMLTMDLCIAGVNLDRVVACGKAGLGTVVASRWM